MGFLIINLLTYPLFKQIKNFLHRIENGCKNTLFVIL